MLWMDLIGEGGGAFYLDLNGCEPVRGEGPFSWRLTGVVGDGQRESGLLVEAGEDLRITFVSDEFDGLPGADPFPGLDPVRLEAAVAEAAGDWLRDLRRRGKRISVAPRSGRGPTVPAREAVGPGEHPLGLAGEGGGWAATG